MKEKITIWEIIARVLIVFLAFFISYYSKDSEKQILSLIGFLIAFLCSIYLHKHFFPFFTAAIGFYLLGCLQEFWNENYTYLNITKLYWTVGNVLLPLGVIDFAFKLRYKYKIEKHVGKD